LEGGRLGSSSVEKIKKRWKPGWLEVWPCGRR
jgi:hypothetical protein